MKWGATLVKCLTLFIQARLGAANRQIDSRYESGDQGCYLYEHSNPRRRFLPHHALVIKNVERDFIEHHKAQQPELTQIPLRPREFDAPPAGNAWRKRAAAPTAPNKQKKPRNQSSRDSLTAWLASIRVAINQRHNPRQPKPAAASQGETVLFHLTFILTRLNH